MQNCFRINVGFACALLGGFLVAGASRADEATCGSLKNPFGPFDYRTIPRESLETVEEFHFTSDVEGLRSGKSGSLGGDLDYTLRAIPNHPRALIAMGNLQFKAKSDHPVGARWSVACYFDRAIRFQPDDPAVHAVYGVYLLRSGRKTEAVEQLQESLRLGGENANVLYNLGLAYFDMGEYEKSVEAAKRAYELGFPLPGLRNKLQRAGKWPAG